MLDLGLVDLHASPPHVARIPVGGTEIVVSFHRDEAETDRRCRHHLAPVTDRRVLALLLTLPEGVAVPWSFLAEADRRLVEQLPEGIVKRTAADVRVVLTPTISLAGVGVVASTWEQGLSRSSPFASHCARTVVLYGSRAAGATEKTCAALEARYLGVGLAVHHGGRLGWLTPPAPFQAGQFSPVTWLMLDG